MPDVEEQPEDEKADETPAAIDDPLVEFITLEKDARLWLAAIRPILTMHCDGTQAEDCPRVRLAWKWMKIAAFERVARIMRSDLPDVDDEDQS